MTEAWRGAQVLCYQVLTTTCSDIHIRDELRWFLVDKMRPMLLHRAQVFTSFLPVELEVGGKPHVPEAPIVAKRRGDRCASPQDLQDPILL